MTTFQDKRSGKVAFLSQCLLNQNTKVPGTACWPGMVKPVVELLDQAGVGIVQLPCPEAEYFGLCRPTGEDIKEMYDSPEYRASCARLSQQIVRQVKHYQDGGYRVACILGVEGSPNCSVKTVPTRHGRVNGSGVFVEVLMEELRRGQLQIPVIGVPESGDLSETLSEIRQVVTG